MTKKKILMAVYNPIEVDGRVKRISASLSGNFDLTLLCVQGSGEFRTPLYSIIRVKAYERIGRVLRLFTFWVKMLRYAIKIQPDIIYAHDFFLPMPGWIVSRLVGAGFVYDAHELIVPADDAPLSQNENLFYKLESLVIKKADLIIAANPERSLVMKEHYGLRQLPTSVGNIPPIPQSSLNDRQILELFPELGKKHAEDIHILYMGDINLERGLRVLVDAFEFLPDHFKLFFVGTGPDLETLKRMASDRFHLLGQVSHDKLYDVIRQTDLGYVTYSMLGLNNVLCAPNKVFEYAQAGLPMVTTCQPTIKNMFAKYRVGELVGCGSALVVAERVADAIQRVAGNIEQYKSNIPAFLSYYRWENESSNLIEAVENVTN